MRIRPLGNPFRRRPREHWYLIGSLGPLGDVLTFGPFPSREKAADYPNTICGIIDAPAFDPAYDYRVERRDR